MPVVRFTRHIFELYSLSDPRSVESQYALECEQEVDPGEAA